MLMKIEENINDDFESHGFEIQESVTEMFDYESKIASAKELISEIKKEAMSLKEIFLNQDEIEEKNKAVGFLDERMQATVYYTLKNIEGYRQYGWKELIDEGENRDERDNFI